MEDTDNGNKAYCPWLDESPTSLRTNDAERHQKETTIPKKIKKLIDEDLADMTTITWDGHNTRDRLREKLRRKQEIQNKKVQEPGTAVASSPSYVEKPSGKQKKRKKKAKKQSSESEKDKTECASTSEVKCTENVTQATNCNETDAVSPKPVNDVILNESSLAEVGEEKELEASCATQIDTKCTEEAIYTISTKITDIEPNLVDAASSNSVADILPYENTLAEAREETNAETGCVSTKDTNCTTMVTDASNRIADAEVSDLVEKVAPCGVPLIENGDQKGTSQAENKTSKRTLVARHFRKGLFSDIFSMISANLHEMLKLKRNQAAEQSFSENIKLVAMMELDVKRLKLERCLLPDEKLKKLQNVWIQPRLPPSAVQKKCDPAYIELETNQKALFRKLSSQTRNSVKDLLSLLHHMMMQQSSWSTGVAAIQKLEAAAKLETNKTRQVRKEMEASRHDVGLSVQTERRTVLNESKVTIYELENINHTLPSIQSCKASLKDFLARLHHFMMEQPRLTPVATTQQLKAKQIVLFSLPYMIKPFLKFTISADTKQLENVAQKLPIIQSYAISNQTQYSVTDFLARLHCMMVKKSSLSPEIAVTQNLEAPPIKKLEYVAKQNLDAARTVQFKEKIKPCHYGVALGDKTERRIIKMIPCKSANIVQALPTFQKLVDLILQIQKGPRQAVPTIAAAGQKTMKELMLRRKLPLLPYMESTFVLAFVRHNSLIICEFDIQSGTLTILCEVTVRLSNNRSMCEVDKLIQQLFRADTSDRFKEEIFGNLFNADYGRLRKTWGVEGLIPKLLESVVIITTGPQCNTDVLRQRCMRLSPQDTIRMLQQGPGKVTMAYTQNTGLDGFGNIDLAVNRGGHLLNTQKIQNAGNENGERNERTKNVEKSIEQTVESRSIEYENHTDTEDSHELPRERQEESEVLEIIEDEEQTHYGIRLCISF